MTAILLSVACFRGLAVGGFAVLMGLVGGEVCFFALCGLLVVGGYWVSLDLVWAWVQWTDIL
ncbi:MAG: hypothetical protein R3Y63_14875 [Eubacteriales bacterium]